MSKPLALIFYLKLYFQAPLHLFKDEEVSFPSIESHYNFNPPGPEEDASEIEEVNVEITSIFEPPVTTPPTDNISKTENISRPRSARTNLQKNDLLKLWKLFIETQTRRKQFDSPITGLPYF